MASGKTTIGRQLAHQIGWNFFDMDAEIEAAEKMTIAEIFSSRGEPEFRRVENLILAQHVRWIERGRPAVLALGGGTFADAPNRDLLRNNGITIWLDCPFEVAGRRIADAEGPIRPLAKDPVRFRALYDSRREAYRMADLHVAIQSDDPAQTVKAILADPIFR
jgi:shikimate kinase